MPSDYKPWTYADRYAYRKRMADRFTQNAQAGDDQRNLDGWLVNDTAKQPTLGLSAAQQWDAQVHAKKDESNRPKADGGGFWGGVKSFASDVRDTAGDVVNWRPGEAMGDAASAAGAALKPLSYPYEHGGKQVAGVVLGASGMERKPVYDDAGNVIGYKREGGQNLVDWAKNVAESIKDPGAAGTAFEEYTSSLPWYGQAAARAGADPLSWVGPGIARAGLRMLPAAKEAGVGANLARHALGFVDTGGGGAVLGANEAAGAEAEYGDRIPGWNKMSPEARQLIAGLVGGLAGGKLQPHVKAEAEAAWRGERGFPGAAMVKSDSPFGANYEDTLGRHDIPFGYESDGTIVPEDVGATTEKANQLKDLAWNDIKGSAGGRQGTRWVYARGDMSAERWQELADAERLDEILSHETPDPNVERARSENWQPGTTLDEYRPMAPEERAVKEARWNELKQTGKANTAEGQRLSRELGADDAHRAIAWTIRPDWSPRRSMYDLTSEEIAATSNPSGHGGADGFGEKTSYTTRERTYLDTLGRAIDDLDANGHDVPHTVEEANAAAGTEPGGADVPPAPDVTPSETVDRVGGEETVKRPDLFGNVHDTYATESELNGWRPEQGAMDMNGEPLPQEATPAVEKPPVEGDPRPYHRDYPGRQHDDQYQRDIHDWYARHPEAEPSSLDFPIGTDGKPGPEWRQAHAAWDERTNGEANAARNAARAAADRERQNARRAAFEVEFSNMSDAALWRVWRDEKPGTFRRQVAEEKLAERGISDPRTETVESMRERERARKEGERQQQRDERKQQRAEERQAKREQAQQERPKEEGVPPLDRSSVHATLGLDPSKSYTEAEIKAAYRAQIRKYHPDLNPSETATADAQAINSAFEQIMQTAAENGGTHPAGEAPRAESTGPRPNDNQQGNQQQGQQEQTFRGQQARQEPPDESWKERARAEQKRADEEAAQRRKERENPPPGGGPSGPESHDWHAAWNADGSYDLFNAESRSAQIKRQEEYLNSLRGRFAQAVRNVAKAFGGEKFDRNLILDTLVRPFVVGEKNRTDNTINHWTAWAREEAQSRFERAGIRVEKASDGAWRIDGDVSKPTLEDVIERSTREADAYYRQMSPQQREAVEFVKWANEAVNKTIAIHGGKVPHDADIIGTYFPRMVDEIAGQKRTSGKSSFRKSRTMESLEEGIGRSNAEVGYANPWDAFEAGMRGKMRSAQDAYMAEMLKPLAVEPDPAKGIRAGFGYDYVDHPAFQQHPMAKPLLFPQEVADRINAALKRREDNMFVRFPKGLNSVLTPLRATGDISASLQQGMAAWLRNPKSAGENWLATVRSLGNDDIYFKAVDRIEQAGPGINEHIRWGGHYTSPHSEGDFMLPALAHKLTGGKVKEIPGLNLIAQKSNEHFSRFLNLVRFDMGNEAYARAQAEGLTGRALDNYMREAWNGINRSSGWTGRRPTTLESVATFAPRYLSASIEQTAAAFTKGGIEGSIARAHLGRMFVAGVALSWAINSARGYPTEWDPRSSNFLRIRNVDGLDISPFGTYDTIARAFFSTLGGRPGEAPHPDITRAWKFAESKMSPALKLVYEPFIKQETYLGEPQNPLKSWGDFANVVGEQAKSSLPFNVQDLIENGPGAALVGSTGLSARLMTENEQLAAARDKASVSQFGRGYQGLKGEQKSVINERPEVTQHQNAVDEQALRRGGSDAQEVNVRREFAKRIEANARFLQQGHDDAGNPFSGNDFRAAYHDMQQYLAGARSMLPQARGNDDVGKWFQLFDKATMPNGQLDFDVLDQLQNDFRSAHPGIDAKVDQVVGIHDNQALRDFRAAQKDARAYYQIPAYRGLTLEQSRKASETLLQAQGLVMSGQARTQKQAFLMLSGKDPEGVMWARIASRAGSNPERKMFRLEHPAYGRFYTDTVS